MAGSKGGRGGKAGSNTVAPQTVTQSASAGQQNANQNQTEIDALRQRIAKLPSTGAKVQETYIDMLKYYHGIDLTGARDTNFDNRRMFNIDTRQLNPSLRSQIRGYLTNVPMFDVQVVDNGAYRLAIIVKKK